MAIRQLMADVRPEEEAALRALVQPVEPVEQPQDGVVVGYWPTAQLSTLHDEHEYCVFSSMHCPVRYWPAGPVVRAHGLP